jgi:adenosyl cobinamide kinase/adenosyl cobinamide phosphate guanylyltransferase
VLQPLQKTKGDNKRKRRCGFAYRPSVPMKTRHSSTTMASTTIVGRALISDPEIQRMIGALARTRNQAWFMRHRFAIAPCCRCGSRGQQWVMVDPLTTASLYLLSKNTKCCEMFPEAAYTAFQIEDVARSMALQYPAY